MISYGLGSISAHAATVLATNDGVVRFSFGVGGDIENSPSFGFDTVRLKENNVRLHFEDSSATGSFPGNDWRITINSSDNGGANYFSIDDATNNTVPFYIEASSPSNTLRIDSAGRIGIKQANPAVDIHVTEGNTPTLRLHQDQSDGFSSHVWDVAANETNFFVRDVTNSSSLPFRIRPGSKTNTDNTLVLQNNGNVIIGGEQSGNAKLHVNGGGYFSGDVEVGSSRDLKENIRELSLDEAVEALNNFDPVHFKYIEESTSRLGFIAEDVPDLVATKERKSIRPMDFVAVLTKVVKEHEKREKELTETVEKQEKRIEELMKRLEAVESSLPEKE